MQKNILSKKIDIKWFILLGAVLHLISTIYTVGFYNQDEHFQVLSPLETLLGINNSLTWEFSYRIRPWLQPYFYFYIAQILNFLQISDPFLLTFFLRLISSIIGFCSILVLYDHFKSRLNIDNNFSKLVIFSFAFYAYLHARTSSENLSISMLIFGMVFLDKVFLKEDILKRKFIFSIISGVFLGLSIVLKFHLAVSVFFIYVWFLFFKLNIQNFKLILFNAFSIIFIILIGLVFDYFGYNQINNTYYNYFYANFVEKWFESFGIDPWWYYLKLFLERFYPPINIIILVSIIFFWIREYKNIITFVSLPVLIFLSLLSHKELRFIFPILIFSPFFICYFFSNIRINLAKNIIKYTYILFNLIFLITIFIPATEQVKVYQFLFYNNKDNNKIFYYDDNPYIISDLEPKLYTSFLPKIEKFDYKNFNKSFVITRNFQSFELLNNSLNCKKVYSVYPEIININKNWRERKFNWYILKC